MAARNPGNADTVLRSTFDRITGTLRTTPSSTSLIPPDSMVQNPGNADEVLRQVYDPATNSLKISGAGSAALSGAGAPTSGLAGVTPGTLYLDTSLTPHVVYINVGTALASSWMSLLSGNVV